MIDASMKVMAENNDWHEKYLTALDSQDELEQHFEQQQTLFGLALMRVSLAADGVDGELDKELTALRKLVKQKTELTPTILKQIENAIDASDERRAASIRSSRSSLRKIATQLTALSRPGAVTRRLKKFRGSIIKRADDLSAHAALLEELAQIHQQVLEQTQLSTKPGMMASLFSGSGAEQQSFDASVNASPKPDAQFTVEKLFGAEDINCPNALPSVTEANAGGIQVDAMPETKPNSRTQVAPPPLASKEPRFSSVAARLTLLLAEFLDNIEPHACVVRKVAAAQTRLHQGLNWYELIPTLEDIRDLVMQSQFAANDGFTEYLNQVNAELDDIYLRASGAVKSEKAMRRAGTELQQHVSGQMSSLEDAVSTSEDLEGLKSQVNHQIEEIRDAVSIFKDHAETAKTPLAEQLKSLVGRVQAMEHEAQTSRRQFAEQKRIAQLDSLTQLPNREAYNDRCHQEELKWQQSGKPLCLAICDIDRFKSVNDTYGHQVGDRVLQVFSRSIVDNLRKADFVARYGGEEFVVLLPETKLKDALISLNAVRETVSKIPFRFQTSPLQVTMSVGVAQFQADDHAGLVFARADKALYQAKQNGRNCCRHDNEETQFNGDLKIDAQALQTNEMEGSVFPGTNSVQA